MKTTSLFGSIVIILFISFAVTTSCNKKTQDMMETENMNDALNMDSEISNLFIYHDSVMYAKAHATAHVTHYDSIFHHHDSLYNHYHTDWHHGDTTHHHVGWHHTPTQHHQHDSIINSHHILVH